MRRICVCLLRRLPLAPEVTVTHPCTFDCHFNMADPGRTGTIFLRNCQKN